MLNTWDDIWAKEDCFLLVVTRLTRVCIRYETNRDGHGKTSVDIYVKKASNKAFSS